MNDDARVTIARIDVPFGNLVMFLVKLSIAAIPAGIIVAIVWGILWAILAGIFGGMTGVF